LCVFCSLMLNKLWLFNCERQACTLEAN
jgi:hypothetical protein